MVKKLSYTLAMMLLAMGPSVANEVNGRFSDEKIDELTSTLREELSKNDRRLGDFSWSTEVQGEYLIWKAFRKSPDCRDKSFLEVERRGVINICSIINNGSIEIRDFESGESLDISYKSHPGLPPKIRTLRLDKPMGSVNEIASMFTQHEAIAVSYEFCTGETTVSFYRNFSIRLSDADDVLSAVKNLAQTVCEGE